MALQPSIHGGICRLFLRNRRSCQSISSLIPPVRFDGQTIIITGAGGDLGRAYSLMFAKLGGNIVVNDVSPRGAHAVVDEIKGGRQLFSSVDGSIRFEIIV